MPFLEEKVPKDSWKSIKYFNSNEFKCPCCGKSDISMALVRRLDMAREIAGVPFRITSGVRCIKHNREVGGVPNSAHLRGLAADIFTPNEDYRFAVIKGVILAGFRRIGIGSKFIHVDVDDSKPQGRIWLYGGVKDV